MTSDKAKYKARVLAFWDKHGLQATLDAFSVKRRTLYLWQSQLTQGQGKILSLNEGSKRPHQVRTRQWHPEILVQIKHLRSLHPNLGKEKLHILLKPWCVQQRLACPSARTIGRLIADQPDKLRAKPLKVSHFGKLKTIRNKPKRQHKPKDFVAQYPGHCGSFDTVEKILHGSRRYVITFTDVYSRFSFAWATTSHGSQAATEFFHLIAQVFPYPLRYILTDNGSEFAKAFDTEVKRQHKTHWHTYPRTPKMNPHVERFNRTLQDEFLDFHEYLLLEPDQCNQEMIDFLLWYNGQRPHWSLNLLSPIQFLKLNHPECNMWWPSTLTCFIRTYSLDYWLLAGIV
jgi:transposase InsO family protein